MAARNPPRRKIPRNIETAALAKSARRCVLCFHLDGDVTEKSGQIAHLDEDRTNYAEDNLAWMCLLHHSLYDSKTSQHKNYTIDEVKTARTKLYDFIEKGKHPSPVALQDTTPSARKAATNPKNERNDPSLSRITRKTKPTVSGLLYSGWYSGSTFGIPSLNTGTCSVLEIKNNLVEIPVCAKGTTARIEYSSAEGSKHFVVPVATWWEIMPGRAPGSGSWRNTADIEGGAFACLVLFVQEEAGLVIYRDNVTPIGMLEYAKWNLSIEVRSETVEGFEGGLSFIIARDGLKYDSPAFVQKRRVPPRSSAAVTR